MPEPIRADRRYMPGLDGLRAVAVLGVLAYHLGFTFIPGGFLGVSVFFTLSGYLITDLILGRTRSGEFTLKSFWFARARRLLPAMFLMLVAVAAWVTVIGPHQNSDFRVAAGTSSIYVNNWWQVAHKVSYFQQFDHPGILNHLWSLAVEEQFYIVWPLLLLALAGVIREAEHRITRPRLGLAILGLAAISSALMAVLFHPGADPSRVYFGTDTRAAELLVGAALATVWPSERLRSTIGAGARNLVDAAAVAGLVVIAVMFLTVHDVDAFLYRGGFMVLSVAVAAVVASMAHPASRLGALLGCRPMRWIGARSYGIYLWHFPVIVLSTPDGEFGTHPLRTPLQILVSFCLAALSWHFVEDPIRHGALGRIWAKWRSREGSSLRRLTPVGMVALGLGALLLLPATAGFAGVGIHNSNDSAGMELDVTKTITGDGAADSTIPATDEPRPTATPSTTKSTTKPGSPAKSTTTTTAGPTTTIVKSTATSCKEVIHVGDSTSTGLIGGKYLTAPDEIPAQYSRVGVKTQHYEIAGGRSINEGYLDARPAKRSAEKWKKQGYSGCWVLALGTMDAAAVAKGINPGIRARIKMMMDIVGNDPVMWVNLKGRRSGGPWGARSLAAWNKALLQACADHPNMRVYDWAADVQKNWYISDGIHQNTPGYKARAAFIADGLAQSFPKTPAASAPTSCLVEI